MAVNVLVAESMSPAGIELLRSQPGWNVVVSNPKEYLNHIAEAALRAAGKKLPVREVTVGINGEVKSER